MTGEEWWGVTPPFHLEYHQKHGCEGLIYIERIPSAPLSQHVRLLWDERPGGGLRARARAAE